MSAPTPMRPVCRSCRKPLRRYRYRKGGPNETEWARPGQQWGDYGDNLFCGLTCGYRWAVRAALEKARAALEKAGVKP